MDEDRKNELREFLEEILPPTIWWMAPKKGEESEEAFLAYADKLFREHGDKLRAKVHEDAL